MSRGADQKPLAWEDDVFQVFILQYYVHDFITNNILFSYSFVYTFFHNNTITFIVCTKITFLKHFSVNFDLDSVDVIIPVTPA